MRKDDILIVRKLDRPGRSLSQLEATVGQFEEEGFGFRSLAEGTAAACRCRPTTGRPMSGNPACAPCGLAAECAR